MKSKKLLLLFFGLFICLIIPKTTKALTFSKLYYFDSSFNILGQYNTTSSTANVKNVKYLRCSYTDSFTSNTQYTANFTYSVTANGNQPYMVWNIAGLNVNGTYVKSAPASQTIITEQQMGAQSYYRQLAYPFSSWTQNTSGNLGVFVQLELQTISNITYFSCDQFTISNNGSSGGGSSSNDTQQIINNNNQNTTNIINNQNSNTQQIINSQEETTQAIEDINDTLQQTEVDDETIGDKVGDINQISDTPITDLITMPLVLLNKLYTGMSGSCVTYTLGTLFNHTLTLPCFNGASLLGSTIWGVIDSLLCFYMLYNIGLMVVHFFESVTSLQDTFDDMYVPQHTYKPKHGGGN